MLEDVFYNPFYLFKSKKNSGHDYAVVSNIPEYYNRTEP